MCSEKVLERLCYTKIEKGCDLEYKLKQNSTSHFDTDDATLLN